MPPDQQPPALQDPHKRSDITQALGMLAAVSAAGLLATRMKPGPLFFLAGAAAAGWLAKRRVLHAQRPLELLPARQPEPAMAQIPVSVPDSTPQVDAWLSRQIARDQEAPVITLDLLDPSPALPAPAPPLEAEVAAPPTPPIPATSPEVESRTPTIFVPPSSIEVAPLVSAEPAQVPVYGLRDDPPPPAPDLGSLFADSFAQQKITTRAAELKPDMESWQPLSTPADAPAADSAWLLGIEPLPSWDEPGASHSAPSSQSHLMQETPLPSFEMAAPLPLTASSAPELPFVPPLFQGATLPDEICVPNMPGEIVEAGTPVLDSPSLDDMPAISLLDTPLSTPPQPAIPLFPPAPLDTAAPDLPPPLKPVFMAPRQSVKPPVPVPLAAAEAPFPAFNASPIEDAVSSLSPPPPAHEVPVTLAAPGEASFDDPFAAMAVHGAPAGIAPPPPPLRPLAPVVEAEIIVRPRGFSTATVIAKAPPTPLGSKEVGLASANATIPESPFHQTADDSCLSSPSLPPAPVVVPREQSARKTWRSWWRGE